MLASSLLLYANELNIKEKIVFEGFHNKILDEIKDAGMYVLSSDYEGISNSLLEAMGMGMPVISTDCPCGGPRTLITHEKNGLLIPVGDEKAMEEAVNRLIEDRDFAEGLGEEARKISNRVDGASVLAQWKEYIEKVLAAYQKQ